MIERHHLKVLSGGIAIALCAGVAAATPSAEADASRCTAIADDAGRLACYDAAFGRQAPGAGNQSTVMGESQDAATARETEAAEVVSNLGRRWELDAGSKKGVFGFQPYKQNYFLPFSHTSSVNTGPYRDTRDASANAGPVSSTDLPIDATEAKFQLSFKVKAWEGVFSDRADLWFGYTQQSFWQVYNGELSAPFRDTDYEPEAMLVVRTDYDVLGLKWRFLNLGLVHQSNGRSEPLSRSWNRVYAQFGFERGEFGLLVRPWARIRESPGDDDNPHITRYMGHGDATAHYKVGGQQFSALGRYNFSSGYGAGQIDWSFPLFGQLKGYVQYFSGYGNNLLDYNHRQNVIGAGILLTDSM